MKKGAKRCEYQTVCSVRCTHTHLLVTYVTLQKYCIQIHKKYSLNARFIIRYEYRDAWKKNRRDEENTGKSCSMKMEPNKPVSDVYHTSKMHKTPNMHIFKRPSTPLVPVFIYKQMICFGWQTYYWANAAIIVCALSSPSPSIVHDPSTL